MSYCEAEMHQIRFRLGLRPTPGLGTYSAPRDSLAAFKGATSKGKGKRRGTDRGREIGGRGVGQGRKEARGGKGTEGENLGPKKFFVWSRPWWHNTYRRRLCFAYITGDQGSRTKLNLKFLSTLFLSFHCWHFSPAFHSWFPYSSLFPSPLSAASNPARGTWGSAAYLVHLDPAECVWWGGCKRCSISVEANLKTETNMVFRIFLEILFLENFNYIIDCVMSTV